jgi:hypothetical protein
MLLKTKNTLQLNKEKLPLKKINLVKKIYFFNLSSMSRSRIRMKRALKNKVLRTDKHLRRRFGI